MYDNKNELTNIYYEDDNPYFIAGLNPKLYTHYLPEISKLNKLNLNDKFYLITRNQLIIQNSSHLKCIKKYSVYPDFIYINPNWKKHKFNWYLFYCNKIT